MANRLACERNLELRGNIEAARLYQNELDRQRRNAVEDPNDEDSPFHNVPPSPSWMLRKGILPKDLRS